MQFLENGVMTIYWRKIAIDFVVINFYHQPWKEFKETKKKNPQKPEKARGEEGKDSEKGKDKQLTKLRWYNS